MKKRVVLIRSNSINPDPPVEKMANTLLSAGYMVTLLGWDRDRSGGTKISRRAFPFGTCEIVSFGISASFGGGLEKNLIPLLRFERAVSQWLASHNEEIEIVHAFDFDTGAISGAFCRRYHKKLVYHILDY